VTIKAIETRYNGYRFRSRLEARWAVFFDELNVTWDYEPQGFDLGKVGPYLPDFWLEEHGCWFEVKGSNPTIDERRKAEALRDVTEAPVILAHGPIGTRPHTFYAYDVGNSSAGNWESDCLWFTRQEGDYPGQPRDGLLLLAVDATSSRSFYSDPYFSRRINWAKPYYTMDTFPSVRDAYMTARGARFEHGENGARCR
jgi:hypothetical protein